MSAEPGRVLSVEEAAQILYNTEAPTQQQLDRVRLKLAKGVLKRSPKGPWTTTAGHVAEYLASRQMHAPPKDGASAADRTARLEQTSRLQQQKLRIGTAASANVSSFYRNLLQDYFLALTARKTARQHNRAFARAVLAGQIAVLLFSLLAIGGVVQTLRGRIQPERAAVLDWITAQHGQATPIEWFDSRPHDNGQSQLVRLRYRYREGNQKGVTTDRTFIVQDRRVLGEWQDEEG